MIVLKKDVFFWKEIFKKMCNYMCKNMCVVNV